MKLLNLISRVLVTIVTPLYFIYLGYIYFTHGTIPNNYHVIVMIVLVIQFFNNKNDNKK